VPVHAPKKNPHSSLLGEKLLCTPEVLKRLCYHLLTSYKGGGVSDKVINMPTKFRLEVRSENYSFSPSLTEFNQKLKFNSELVTSDL